MGFGKTILSATMAAACSVGLTTAAHADTFNITLASGHPPVLVHVRLVDEVFMPEVDRLLEGTGHSVNWTPAYAGSLAKMGSVLESVRDGIAEGGLIAASFEPANLPLQLVTLYSPFSSTDILAASRVIDGMTRNNPAMVEGWAKHNLKYLGGICHEPVQIFSTKSIDSIDDLKGVKIGGVGANLSWLQNIATGVTIAGGFGAIYNDIQTGVYDAVLTFPSAANSLKLVEVAPYMLKMDFGTACWGGLVINSDLFDSMPEVVQDAIVAAGQLYNDEQARQQNVLATEGMAAMLEQGLQVVEISQEERERWATTMPNVAADWVKTHTDLGLPADDILAEYMTKIVEAGQTPVRDWPN